MAATVSQSSPPSNDDQIPTVTLAVPSTRRLPPPCWTEEETVALIEAYKDKWYSLRRGNLRANHWQEVADDVAVRCPASPRKTAVQCRHKMEKLRKRYRSEIQRAAARGGVRRYTSAWAHFMSMHAMDNGPDRTPPSSSSSDEHDDLNNAAAAIKRINNLYNYNNQKSVFGNPSRMENTAPPGFRIKIPAAKVYPKFEETGQNPRFTNSSYGAASGKVSGEGFLRRGEMGKRAMNNSTRKKSEGVVDEVVAAIQGLGEGLMRIEKVKMDVARQIEEMRMKNELKRTEMILASQQRIVEAFATAVSEHSAKKAKKMLARYNHQV